MGQSFDGRKQLLYPVGWLQWRPGSIWNLEKLQCESCEIWISILPFNCVITGGLPVFLLVCLVFQGQWCNLLLWLSGQRGFLQPLINSAMKGEASKGLGNRLEVEMNKREELKMNPRWGLVDWVENDVFNWNRECARRGKLGHGKRILIQFCDPSSQMAPCRWVAGGWRESKKKDAIEMEEAKASQRACVVHQLRMHMFGTEFGNNIHNNSKKTRTIENS